MRGTGVNALVVLGVGVYCSRIGEEGGDVFYCLFEEAVL